MNPLKYLALSVLIIIFVFDLSFAEDKQYGFQDIPFGASYEEVRSTLNDRENKYGGNLLALSDFIVLRNFWLGNLNVDVYFYFDHNKNFYSFSFHSKPKSAGFIDKIIDEDGKQLTEIFKNKYGKPKKCFNKPNVLTIKQGYITYLCKWDNKDLDIYTGIGVDEFKYSAQAIVKAKKMESILKKYEKEQQSEKIKEGAKKF